MAGANLIYGMGMMEMGVTFSLVQLMIDDAIVNDVKKMIVSDVGVDNISSREWLDKHHGRGFPLRYWSPHKLRGREVPFHGSRLDGRIDITDRADQRVQTILNNHRLKQLPQATIKKIREIIIEAGERRKWLCLQQEI